MARIALSEEEVELFREQLSQIMEQFQVLSQLDTAAVTLTIQGGPLPQRNAPMRDDVPDLSLDSEEVLSNAPHREGDFFRVKVVLEE